MSLPQHLLPNEAEIMLWIDGNRSMATQDYARRMGLLGMVSPVDLHNRFKIALRQLELLKPGEDDSY